MLDCLVERKTADDMVESIEVGIAGAAGRFGSGIVRVASGPLAAVLFAMGVIGLFLGRHSPACL